MRPPVQRLIQLFEPNLKFMCRLPDERIQNGISSNCLLFYARRFGSVWKFFKFMAAKKK